jgi:hypothetical protein
LLIVLGTRYSLGTIVAPNKRWKLAVFFQLYSDSLSLCQQTTTASICDRCTGARAAFRFCIINCRTPVVIDTCARHGSKRRGREEGEGK